jgi:hypothetical protein
MFKSTDKQRKKLLQRPASLEIGRLSSTSRLGGDNPLFSTGIGTGLAITIIAIVTLFVVMQVTGKIRWSERFAARGGVGVPKVG